MKTAKADEANKKAKLSQVFEIQVNNRPTMEGDQLKKNIYSKLFGNPSCCRNLICN